MTGDYEKLMAMVNGYQSASVLMAACELDLFTAIMNERTATVESLAASLRLDQRGLDALVFALLSLGFLEKSEGYLSVPERYHELLDSKDPESAVPMIRHLACCQRSWSQLAWTVKSGIPIPKTSGLNGFQSDYQSFILGMNTVGRRLASGIADQLNEGSFLTFRNMLDLGGASGTYTLAFLARCPQGKATIFDLPIALDEAKVKLAQSPMASRIELAPGDFYQDELPSGFDLVWVSAIIHQQDATATEEMFRKVARALEPGGRIMVRDVYVNENGTGPVPAALFGLNMLVNTNAGRVYSRKEVFDLLTAAGFCNPRNAIVSDDMTSVIVAGLPG